MTSMTTALSGLDAASTALQVTGNNIANSQTTGFKESVTQFADQYSNGFGTVSKTQVGAGVSVAEVAQQFSQGAITSTSNSLDLAINGNGFFMLSNTTLAAGATPTSTPPSAYTRNGAFQLDNVGNIVTSTGQSVLCFKPNGTTEAQGFSTGTLIPLQINTAQGLPTSTSTVNLGLNLNAANTTPVNAFSPTDPTSYNSTTSITTYASQGNSHSLSTYYVNTGANTWNVFMALDGHGITPGNPAATVGALNAAGGPTPVTFDAAGALATVNGIAVPPSDFSTGTIDLSQINPNLNVNPMTLDMNLAGTTQFSTLFSVNTQTQNGLTAGNLTGVSVDAKGAISANYSNGSSVVLGQVALANFKNPQGLNKIGNSDWTASADSGAPITGAAGDNNFGAIKSSALESSNVNLSNELVNLIVQQQAYQANTQAITTEKTLMQSVLQL